MFTPKPHVSAALQHLRFGVTGAGTGIVIAVILQMLVFGFVHFTNVRWTEMQPAANHPRELRIVRPNANEAHSLSGRGSAAQSQANAPDQDPPAEAADVNRVLNRNDFWLSSVSGLARTLGSISAVALVLLLFEGVMIAGGACVPGVEKAVTASTWSIVVALVCLPTASMLPGIPFEGALAPYTWITASSEAIRAGAPDAPGAMTFFGSTMLAPILVGVVVMMIVLRFHAGVENGVIVTSVSELDEKLRREISSIKMGAVSAPRSVGALRHAIGEEPSSLPASHPGFDRRIGERRIDAPTPGQGLQRPI